MWPTSPKPGESSGGGARLGLEDLGLEAHTEYSSLAYTRKQKMGFFIFSVHWPSLHEDKEVEAMTENLGQPANLWVRTSVNQLHFIPEYREYVGLGSLGTNLNLH